MPELMLEAGVRATLLAAAAALILLVTQIKQPSARHAVWTGVILVMLAMPLLVARGLHAPMTLLPAPQWQSGELSRTAGPVAAPAAHTNTPLAPVEGAAVPQVPVDWLTIATTIYLAGVLILLLRLALGLARVRALLSQASLRDGHLTHSACAAPVTAGCFRPRVVLPPFSRHWPARHLAAILDHEREHARRRDPLIQFLALLNRAIVWFHPLAWWLERELARLAEEACDDAVISRGHHPREYAECLLRIARSVADSGTRLRVLGAAAVGAGLPARIRAILTSCPAGPESRLRLASVVVASAAAAVALSIGSVARAQLTEPSFEVATIRPNRSGEQGGSSGFEGNSYRGTNVSLLRVTRLAYSPIQEFHGATGWMESERYDILARAEGSPTRQQMQLMLRSLLADRFHLVVHKETREKPAFALVLARPDGRLGPKLRPSDFDCSPANREKAPKGACGFRAGNGLITSRSATMDMLAAELILTGRLVVDRTGLTGTYDLDLRWTPDEFETSSELITALREQLGLKLEAIRAPVEVLVIDKAERPSAN